MFDFFLSRQSVNLIRSSRLFDAEWYTSKYELGRRVNPALHYLKSGWKKGYKPSVYFDTDWYLSKYPDVADADICPLWHFITSGALEARSTSPFFTYERMVQRLSRPLDGQHPILAYLHDRTYFSSDFITLFDSNYYLHSANGLCRIANTEDPFSHYINTGWKIGLDPHPLFSTNYYINNNPQIKNYKMNPLEHYVKQGAQNLASPHEMFDSHYYATQLSQFIKGDGLNPLLFFLEHPTEMRANPHPSFDTRYYLKKNPDVAQSGMNPLIHYVVHGQAEGRICQDPMSLQLNRDNAIHMEPSLSRVIVGSSLCPISVIIPTYNRVEVLSKTLHKCINLREGSEIQFVIVNDGSTDGTRSYLSEFCINNHDIDVLNLDNGGPGIARNKAVGLAKHDIVMFIGDDIQPSTPDFFNAHRDFHSKRSSITEAMIGKTIWPNNKTLHVGPVMRHIQGRGGEQFGFADLTPYTWLDWRFFYTSNVSIKKNIVADWGNDGFSHQFKLYGFEDIELAYRLYNISKGDFKIFYDPISEGEHFHPYSFNQFVERQINTGRMARKFIDIHPTALSDLGLGAVSEALQSGTSNDAGDITDLLSVFEGLRGWVSYLERNKSLGNSGFHDDLLGAYFEFAFHVGFINSPRDHAENTSAALNFAYRNFGFKMRRAIRTEVSAHDALFPLS